MFCVVRDILYHDPERTGTDIVKALDVANRLCIDGQSCFDFGLRVAEESLPPARNCAAPCAVRIAATISLQFTSRIRANRTFRTWES